MQLDKDELKKVVALATQNAWRRDTLTTVNSIVEYIVNEVNQYIVDQLNQNFADMQQDIDELFAAYAALYDKLKEQENGIKDGRVPQSKRGPKAKSGGQDDRISAG